MDTVPAAAAWVRRHSAWCYPAFTFVLAFGIRLYWVRHAIIAPYGDVASLETFAHNVATGLYYGGNGVYWPPLFIFLAGFTERFFGTGHSLLAVRTLIAVISSLGVAALTDLGRRLLHSPAAGLVAGILMAFYVPSIYYSNVVLNVTTTVTMFLLTSDAIIAFMDRPGWKRLVVAGVLLGLAALSKPIAMGLVVPAFIAWGLRSRRGFDLHFAGLSLAGLVIIALLVNVPWTVRNWVVTGSPVFVDMNGGVNFYLAHNPKADGYFVNMGNNDPVLAGWDLPSTGKRAMHAGEAYFFSHPGADLHQALTVTRLFWESPDWDIPVQGKPLLTLLQHYHIPPLQFLTIRLLALAGLVCLIPLRRRIVFIVVTVLGYNLGLALFFFAPRFRLPIEPLLLLCVAGGVVQAVKWIVRDLRETASDPGEASADGAAGLG